MTLAIDIRSVIATALSTYARQWRLLVPASAAAVAVADLAGGASFSHGSAALALAVVIVRLAAVVLYAAFVVAICASAAAGEARPPMRALLSTVRSAAAELTLALFVVGVGAVVVIDLISTVGVIVFVGTLIGSGGHPAGGTTAIVFGASAGLIAAAMLSAALLLLTRWAVAIPVVVLEGPGSMRSLGRSRELVRGNGLRVLALVLLTLAAVVGVTLLAHSLLGRAAASLTAAVGQAAVGTLLAPVPLLAVTSLYLALRDAEGA